MNLKIVCLILSLTALPLCISANNDKEVVPPVENGWNNDKADRDRSLSISPSLFKEVNHVYYQDNATYGGDNYSLERKMYPAIPNVFN